MTFKVKCITCGINTDLIKTINLGKKGFRCKKCEKQIQEMLLRILKSKRKIWLINPITRIKPNKKKKTRAQSKVEFRRKNSMRDFEMLDVQLDHIAEERALKTIKKEFEGKLIIGNYFKDGKVTITVKTNGAMASIKAEDEIREKYDMVVGREREKIYLKLLKFFIDLIKEEKDV